MAWQLQAIRTTLRLLPAPLRERLAVRLFLTVRRHREPPREEDWRSRGSEMQVAGLEAVVYGAPDRPAAILIHGWEGRGLQLCAYIDPLVAAGHRVIALDGPGHGGSDGMPGLPSWSAALERVIHEVDPAIIIGHSFGGAASIVAAARTQYQGQILCLGGPPETMRIFERAREFMGLPPSGLPRFLALLRRRYEGIEFQDVLDIEAAARRWDGLLHAVLADGDQDIPVEESRRIVEAGGGDVAVVHAGHRSVMWEPEAVQAGLKALGIQLVV